MHELADLVFLSCSGVARLIDRMEREGLVARTPVADDCRGACAILTQKGGPSTRLSPSHHATIHARFSRHLNAAHP